jgi:hypothetical protein
MTLTIKMDVDDYVNCYQNSIKKYLLEKSNKAGSIRKLSDISGMHYSVIDRAIKGKCFPKLSSMKEHFPDFKIELDITSIIG